MVKHHTLQQYLVTGMCSQGNCPWPWQKWESRSKVSRLLPSRVVILLAVHTVLDVTKKICPNISLSESPLILREESLVPWWPSSATRCTSEGSDDNADVVVCRSRPLFLSMHRCTATLLCQKKVEKGKVREHSVCLEAQPSKKEHCNSKPSL